MSSSHVNLKLSQEYMQQLREIGRAMGFSSLSSHYGATAQAIKFSIALASFQIRKLEEVIPTVEPRILEILLSTVKQRKAEAWKALQGKESPKSTAKGNPQISDMPPAAEGEVLPKPPEE